MNRQIASLLIAIFSVIMLTSIALADSTKCQTYDEHLKWKQDNEYYQKMYFNIESVIDGELFYRIDLLVQGGGKIISDPISPLHYLNNWVLVLVRENSYCFHLWPNTFWRDDRIKRGGWGLVGPNQFSSLGFPEKPGGWRMVIIDEFNNIQP